MDYTLHGALDYLARRPFDGGLVILDEEQADALQQLIVDMHAAHARTDRRNDILMLTVKLLNQALDNAGSVMDYATRHLKGSRT